VGRNSIFVIKLPRIRDPSAIRVVNRDTRGRRREMVDLGVSKLIAKNGRWRLSERQDDSVRHSPGKQISSSSRIGEVEAKIRKGFLSTFTKSRTLGRHCRLTYNPHSRWFSIEPGQSSRGPGLDYQRRGAMKLVTHLEGPRSNFNVANDYAQAQRRLYVSSGALPRVCMIDDERLGRHFTFAPKIAFRP